MQRFNQKYILWNGGGVRFYLTERLEFSKGSPDRVNNPQVYWLLSGEERRLSFRRTLKRYYQRSGMHNFRAPAYATFLMPKTVGHGQYTPSRTINLTHFAIPTSTDLWTCYLGQWHANCFRVTCSISIMLFSLGGQAESNGYTQIRTGYYLCNRFDFEMLDVRCTTPKAEIRLFTRYCIQKHAVWNSEGRTCSMYCRWVTRGDFHFDRRSPVKFSAFSIQVFVSSHLPILPWTAFVEGSLLSWRTFIGKTWLHGSLGVITLLIAPFAKSRKTTF